MRVLAGVKLNKNSFKQIFIQNIAFVFYIHAIKRKYLQQNCSKPASCRPINLNLYAYKIL